MKKATFLSIICAALTFTACEKDEVGGTATEAMAGEWYVTVDVVDEDDDPYLGSDPYGMGHFLINTYNTAANTPDKMFVDDNFNFWGFKSVVNCNQSNLTFTSDGPVASIDYDRESQPNIYGGKIMYGAATTPHGTPADSIVFYVVFGNDDYGFIHKVSGYRYTGLVEDD